MPLYVGDYLADTTRLTTQQHGAYLLLIMDYWRSGPPPDDDTVLAQITKAERREWARLRPVLLAYFEPIDGEWRHKRIDKEKADAVAGKEKASRKAQAAAEARWKHEREQAASNAPSIGQAMHEECPSPSPTPLTTKATPKARQKAVALPDWIPYEAWGEWAKHRGGKLTPQAVTRQVKTLAALMALGHDPAAMIDLAIERGWATFYAPRPQLVRSGEAKAAVTAEIWKREPIERHDDRDITGESERVA